RGAAPARRRDGHRRGRVVDARPRPARPDDRGRSRPGERAMSFDLERIYALLPAIDRIRDVAVDDGVQGGPLRALLSVVAGEVAVLEENLTQLYEDQFIETCAEWVVPYIGDLLGIRPQQPIRSGAFSERAFVANILAARRRKGTILMLEEVARDATLW